MPFVDPYKRVRDMVRFLRVALTGEKVTEKYDSFEVQGFRLGLVPEVQPPILVAALREGMLRLAGREGDGAIINWLSADDVKQVVPHVQAGGADKEIVCRIFVAPSEETDAVRAAAKFAIAAYLNVPVYAEFHRWLGRGDVLTPMWDAWKAGDRKQAIAEIPDSLVDELVVHGSPAQCRAHIQRYFDNGVTTSSLAVMPFPGVDHWEAVRALSPSAPSASDFLGASGCQSPDYAKRTRANAPRGRVGTRGRLVADVPLREVLSEPAAKLEQAITRRVGVDRANAEVRLVAVDFDRDAQFGVGEVEPEPARRDSRRRAGARAREDRLDESAAAFPSRDRSRSGRPCRVARAPHASGCTPRLPCRPTSSMYAQSAPGLVSPRKSARSTAFSRRSVARPNPGRAAFGALR